MLRSVRSHRVISSASMLLGGLLLLGQFLLSCPARAAQHPLRVHRNQRYLTQADGKPFFYLGDTAWELFHRLSLADADRYLSDRAAKGFTVIQAVLLAELDGIHSGNAQGDKPLLDDDPTKPNPRYFEHVDAIIDRAATLGLTMGILPTWGDKVFEKHVNPGPRIFTPENARVYGRFLAERYQKKPVIWILGGDRDPESKQDYAIVRAMAEGIRSIDKQNLMTYHPRGQGRSSDFFHRESWLSFNMFQSGHTSGDLDNGVYVDHDLSLRPPKPSLDGEPRYEAIEVDFSARNHDPFVRFSDWDARRAGYWSLLAGAAGHTYGNGNIWQMWEPKHNSVLGANIPWYAAINHPGAFQMGHMRRLFESRPFERFVPDQTLIGKQPGEIGGTMRAARMVDRSSAFIYTPRGDTILVELSMMRGARCRAHWFDPRYGVAYHIHTGSGTGARAFVPPTSGPGQDWVLVLDDDASDYPMPGTTAKK